MSLHVSHHCILETVVQIIQVVLVVRYPGQVHDAFMLTYSHTLKRRTLRRHTCLCAPFAYPVNLVQLVTVALYMQTGINMYMKSHSEISNCTAAVTGH